MRQMYCDSEGSVRITEAADPVVEAPTDVLVRVRATTICGSDVHLVHGHLPTPWGFALGHEYVGEVVAIGPGGKGANQAVAAARAGGARTTFVAALGHDDAAELLLGSLRSAGVDTTTVVRADAATGTALIVVGPDGENAIVVAPGANGRLVLGPEAAARLAEADVVLAQLEVPLGTVVDAARARRVGSLMVLNAAPSRALPDDLWAELDVLVVNEHEARDLAGPEAHDLAGPEARDLAGPGALPPDDPDASAVPGPDGGRREAALAGRLLTRVPAVVVTLGARGCLVAERDRPVVHVAAPHVEPVDTTGAGDTFCGVLAAHLARGTSLADAARAAVVAGALAVTRRGAQDAVPDAADVDRALSGDPAQEAR